MMQLGHIINPVAVDVGSRFHYIQMVTYKTMQIARYLSKSDLNVEFLSVHYPEDCEIIPKDFRQMPELQRSVLDFSNFRVPRKLPLIKDILSIALDNSQADYFIYTNVDIGVMPHFYQTIRTYIKQGYDAFTINRRTISDKYDKLTDIPLMYAELGQPHRGWDCFIFERSLTKKFLLGAVCLGVPLVGLALISNLIVSSKNFHQFTQEHLTFHLGNDRSWRKNPYDDYALYNYRQVLEILQQLESIYSSFPSHSPPGRFLAYNRNPVLAWIYASLMKFHIPAKYTRREKNL